MDEWMDEWINGWMNGWVNELIKTERTEVTFASHLLQVQWPSLNSRYPPDCWAVLGEPSLQPEMGVESQKLKPSSREWEHSRYFLSGQNLVIFLQPSLATHDSPMPCDLGHCAWIITLRLEKILKQHETGLWFSAGSEPPLYKGCSAKSMGT